MKRSGERVTYNEMPAGELVRHLVDVQHPYLLKALATFSLCGKTIAGASSDELTTNAVSDILKRLEDTIKHYLECDEKLFFSQLSAFRSGKPVPELHLLLEGIRQKHAVITANFRKLRAISNHYNAPADASASLRLCYAQLFNFEQDILKHLFLEEDILFAKLVEANKKNK
jgi:regulator of cell morphogenesis and NO signaling